MVEGTSINEAWENAMIELLRAGDHRIINLVVHITDAMTEPDPQYIRTVDGTMLGRLRVRAVARTLLPRGVLISQDWERRTARLLPKLPHNSYFKRMVDYDYGGGRVNQIAKVVEALSRTNASGSRLVDPGPIVVPRPGVSAMAKRSFPCLSQVQFHRDGDCLVCTATYRSHYYHELALGNFVGLGRLLQLVAREAGLRAGELTIISTDARIGQIRRVESLLGKLGRCID